MPSTRSKLEIIIEASGRRAAKEIASFAKQSGMRMKKMADQSEAAFKRVTQQVFSLKGAFVTLTGGYGLGRVAASFLDAARTTENYKTRLQVLLGSVEEGNRLFHEMANYASRVPFQYKEIMGAATQLTAIMKGGVDEVKQWMPMIGDLAAASGFSIQQVTEQVIRMYSAGAASADLFRERGVLAMLGFQAGVSYSAEETRKKMWEAWQKADSQFRGATEKMADDWDGIVSMISDKWFQLRNLIMEAGVFDELKKQLSDLNEKSGEWIKNNETIIRQKVPQYIKQTRESLEGIWNVISYDPAILEWGLIGLAIGGKKGAVIIGGLAHMKTWAENLSKALAMASKGIIGFREIATANFKELEELVKKGEAIMRGPSFRGKVPKPPPLPTSPKAPEPLPISPKAPEGGTALGGKVPNIDLKARMQSLQAFHDQAIALAQARQQLELDEMEAGKEFAADRLNAYTAMYGTLRELGFDDYEFRKSLIEKQAEEYRAALQGQVDAEALTNAWRQAEMARLDEERFRKQHEVMDALRESWGLTWQEIRQGAVNVWQDIGEAMATVTHQIGSSLTAVVTGAKSAKDAAKDLFKSMLSQAISTLVQIAAQKLIFAAIQKKVMAGITATTVASMSGIAAAAAPAAMLTSIATAGGSAAAGAAAFSAAMGTMSSVSAGVIAAMSSAAAAAQGSVGAPFAAGGIETKPTYHLIAEEGPEAVVPLSPRRRRQARAILDEVVPVVMPEATSRSVVPALGGVPLRSEPEIHVYVQMDFHGDVKLDADLDDIRESIGISVEDAVRGALS